MVIDFYDQHGKRRLKTLPEGTTKKKARKALREIEASVERGTFLPDGKIPSFKEVASDWLEYKKPNVRYSTYEQYKGHIEKHLKPYFGNTRISRVNFDAIEKFIGHLTEAGMISPTVKKVLTTLGAILKYATRKRYIEHNAVSDIDKPRDIRNKKEMEVLRPEEIRAFLEAATNQKHRTLFTLAIMSGAREGELIGLKWTDIDWLNNQVYIRRTFNHGRFFEPKSEKSRRAIDLGPTVISELKRWKLACPPNDLDLVFPSEIGTPIDCNNMVKREFFPALAKAKLRRIRFHDLRHTFAALLIAQGEHPKYIQAQMGHHSINVTMDVYGHLMESVNQKASKRLDEAVFQESGDKMVTEIEKGLSSNG